MDTIEIPWGLARRLAELGRRIKRKRDEDQKLDVTEISNIMIPLLEVDEIVRKAYKPKAQ